MGDFNLETADALQLMNEIIRITLNEYDALGKEIVKPYLIEEVEEQEMIDELMEKYLDTERLLESYFKKLKELLKKSPLGRLEFELKQKELENLIKKNGLQ